MCGIAGIVNLAPGLRPPGRDAMLRMIGALRHRGPDELGLFRDGEAALGHARLSVIDLASGQQPMLDELGSQVVVYNGELYDYVELREALAARGHRFRTQSDTEVLLVAWREWGEEAFHRFNGQWAFALWDGLERRLVLCRDRMGVRPLHYLTHAGRLYFASEVKALFAAEPAIVRELDPVGIEQTFTFWSSVSPRTVFNGVSELEPGHVRVYAGGEVTDRAWWTPRFAPSLRSERPSIEDSLARVSDALTHATTLRTLRADVPVGSYLSGGLDSSLVAALGQRAKGEGFHTFSIRFEDAEYDETAYQSLMAERLGSTHHRLTVSASDIARAFPDVVRHAERPLLRTAPAPLFLLSREVRRAGIKVVLTGEGADEVFAGYDLFREGKIRRFWAKRPESKQRPRLLERLYPYLGRSPVAQRRMAEHFFGQDLAAAHQAGFAHQTRWRTTRALRRLLTPELAARVDRDVVSELLSSLPPDLPTWSPLAQDQYLEMRTLLAGYLLSSQGDRMLMAHSVEGRFPFLDRDVIELAASLPDSAKLSVLDEKHVLKRMAKELVPAEIVRRVKQPYRAPDAAAFVAEGAPDWIDWAMSPSALAASGVFDPAVVSRLWAKCREHRGEPFSNTDNMAVVGVLSTQLLHEQLIRSPPQHAPVELSTLIERVPP